MELLFLTRSRWRGRAEWMAATGCTIASLAAYMSGSTWSRTIIVFLFTTLLVVACADFDQRLAEREACGCRLCASLFTGWGCKSCR